jgi:mono/diheme cytochrome c family protein/rhodanese-related sulfurtransferase
MVLKNSLGLLAALSIVLFSIPAAGLWFPPLTEAESVQAGANYQQYCSLCHGADRQGYVNDDAPSLRTESLIAAGFPEHILYAIAYGRRGTPMAAFLDDVGGPLTEDDILLMVRWLQEQSGFEPFDLPLAAVEGDVALGRDIYGRECVACHGINGEGGKGTALGNQTMLSLTTDAFLKFNIEHGREGTEMPAFREKLQPDEIDAVTAFLRSRAGGWSVEKPVYRAPPAPENYVLNPDSPDPEFELKDDRYVLSKDLYQAMQDKRKLMLLDTRVSSMWQMAHIEGAVPIPYYYENFDALVPDLPTDGTWIVSYCECPRAAAESVEKKLRARGFENTAVLWEGIQGWISLGYPVSMGQSVAVEKIELTE